jgi:16S rRNA processing protein RimM
MELPEDPDEFYDHQLVGLAVIHEGKAIGKVSEVIHLPAQDVLAITKTDGTESLVPFVLQFVPEVDIRGGKLTITPPPGLIDESEAIVIRDTEDED